MIVALPGIFSCLFFYYSYHIIGNTFKFFKFILFQLSLYIAGHIFCVLFLFKVILEGM